MKELPILFSNEMVKALLLGTKTQTRRTINANQNRCPFGNDGDILWVRETHYVFGTWYKNGITEKGRQKWKFVSEPTLKVYFEDTKHGLVINKNSDRFAGYYKRLARFMPKKYARTRLIVEQTSIEALNDITESDAIAEGVGRWVETRMKSKPMHYQLYENFDFPNDPCLYSSSAIGSFESLWRSINGADSWNENPKVRVVKFKIYSISDRPF